MGKLMPVLSAALQKVAPKFAEVLGQVQGLTGQGSGSSSSGSSSSWLDNLKGQLMAAVGATESKYGLVVMIERPTTAGSYDPAVAGVCMNSTCSRILASNDKTNKYEIRYAPTGRQTAYFQITK
jgi:hypothetical protein